MSRKKRKLLCAICGVRPAITKDHIPPKGIFPSPRPSNLITVPACKPCNHGDSELDERFRVDLSHHVGLDDSLTENLWNDTLRTLEKNRKLKNKILSGIEETYFTTPQGIIYEKGYRRKWDSAAHDAIIERTIRGLYYHHLRHILANTVHVKTHWFKTLNKDLYTVSENWPGDSLGRGQFVYRFNYAADTPLHSVWIFQFYSRHWAGGYTTPIAEANLSLQTAR